MENIASPWIGYLIILLNGLVLVMIGLFSKKLNKNTNDYFAAGHKVKWPLLSASVVVVFAYASTILLAAEGAYLYGWPAIWMYVVSGGSLILMMPFFKKIKRILPNGTTLPEFLKMKMGRKVHILTIIISIYILFINLLYMLTGLGSGLAPLFDIPYSLIIVVSGAIIVLYSLLGGLWGSLITDYIQYFIIWLFVSIAAIVVVSNAGGFGKVYDDLVAMDISKGFSFYTHDSLINYGLFMFFGYLALALVDQTILQRVYAVNDSKKLPKMLSMGYLGWALLPMVSGLFGIIALQQGYELPGALSSQALPTVIIDLAPFWVVIAFSLLVFNAIASTANSILVGLSNLVTNDIYKNYINKNADPNKTFLFAKVLVVIGGIIGVLISVTPNSILQIGMYMVNFVIIFASPVIMAFLMKRVNTDAVFWSMLIGFVLALFISGKESILGMQVYTWQINIFLYLLGMAIVYFGTKILPSENNIAMDDEITEPTGNFDTEAVVPSQLSK